jgi:hypothetical protein
VARATPNGRGPVSNSGQFTSGKNGQITGSLTLSPPPSTLSCPPGQSRVIVSVTYTGGTASVVPAGATEAPVGPEELAISGPFSATGAFEPTAECPSFHTTHSGEGIWSGLGDVTFVLDYCVTLGAEAASPLTGTATITAADGTLTGTVEGSLSGTPSPEGYPALYTATITGGTGVYEAAGGTLDLEGVWDDPEVPVLSMHGTVAGTIELAPPALPQPTSILDCLHGGWRNVVDDDGNTFETVWRCVIHVVTHARR